MEITTILTIAGVTLATGIVIVINLPVIIGIGALGYGVGYLAYEQSQGRY